MAGVAVLAIAGIAFAAKGGGSSAVTLCVAKGSGEVALGSKQGKCAKGERKLVVGQRGPSGPRGAQGPAGQAGVAGKPLSLAAAAARPVAPASEQCKANPGAFCGTPGAPGTWASTFESPVTYRQDAAGWVYLTGTATAAQSGSESQFGEIETIFYLPPGMRPGDGIRRFYVYASSCNSPASAPYYVDVYPNGAVKPQLQGYCSSLGKVVFHP